MNKKSIKRKKSSCKRQLRATKRYLNNGGSFSRIATLVPDRLLVTLKYTEKIQYAPGATTYEYIYRGNSINDPNFTGTGGRPVGYTEWSAFYNRYRVVGSKITLKIIGSSATTLSIFPSLSNTGVAGFADAVSQPYSRWVSIAGSGGMNVKSISNSISTSKISGQKIEQDDLYAASFSSDPSAVFYWCLNMDGGSSNVDITAVVTLEYRTILYRRKSPDTSTLVAFRLESGE